MDTVSRLPVGRGPHRLAFRILNWFFGALAVIVLIWLLWGGDFLVATDPVPSHADAAVVLQGSIVAEKSRLAGAMSLAQQGIVDRVLVSVPKEGYWGQPIPQVAAGYIERTYGRDLAARTDFCETGPEVNSTIQEAETAMRCIQAQHWKSVAVVTSQYHTRRARMAWRGSFKRSNLELQLSVQGVADPEFQRHWWEHRQAAKIFLEESLKLIWAAFGG